VYLPTDSERGGAHAGDRTGTAIAAIATSGYTGFLVGPPLIGSLAEALSLRGALGVLGALAC